MIAYVFQFTKNVRLAEDWTMEVWKELGGPIPVIANRLLNCTDYSEFIYVGF